MDSIKQENGTDMSTPKLLLIVKQEPVEIKTEGNYYEEEYQQDYAVKDISANDQSTINQEHFEQEDDIVVNSVFAVTSGQNDTDIPDSNGKSFNCKECNELFGTLIELNKHLEIHLNFKNQRPKPFKCQECDKCFITSFQLNKHSITHTGENCDKKSSQGSDSDQSSDSHPKTLKTQIKTQ
ncbi:unnamed protein product, partial [Owenia fusiformis]